ncbi:MAG: Sec-independent protein translocase protein TatB [Burkholderiales bacterium]
MFDIGFTELMVIAIVALVVIGPEKLPKVARTIGAYLGRLQRYVNDVKADINRELELDELRKFKQTVEDTARSFESSVQSEVSGAEAEVNKIAQVVAEPLANLDPTASTDVLPAATDVPVPAIESPALHSTPTVAIAESGDHVAQPALQAADARSGSAAPAELDSASKRAA